MHVADLLHSALARIDPEAVNEDVQGEGFVDDLVVCLATGRVFVRAAQDGEREPER